MDTQSQSKLVDRKSWSEQDDCLLKQGIEKFGNDWISISNHLGTRNASQCAQRWRRIKKKKNLQDKRNTHWTQQESKQLLILVKDYGSNWQIISEMLGNKSGRQVREKYLNNLNPKLKKEEWTDEEDQKLYELFLQYGCKWTFIKKYLPNRSERMIKNRFYNKIRYSHLKLKNPYTELNYKEDPYQNIISHRTKLIEQSFSQQEVTVEEKQEEDISQFINLSVNYSAMNRSGMFMDL